MRTLTARAVLPMMALTAFAALTLATMTGCGKSMEPNTSTWTIEQWNAWKDSELERELKKEREKSKAEIDKARADAESAANYMKARLIRVLMWIGCGILVLGVIAGALVMWQVSWKLGGMIMLLAGGLGSFFIACGQNFYLIQIVGLAGMGAIILLGAIAAIAYGSKRCAMGVEVAASAAPALRLRGNNSLDQAAKDRIAKVQGRLTRWGVNLAQKTLGTR